MPIIGRLIARGLMCLDTFLSYFATVTVDTSTFGGGQCANLVVYNATITPCGESVYALLVNLIEFALWASNSYLVPGLSGLLAS
jgi:hypothetical protein